MSSWREFYNQICRSPKNVSFRDLCRLAEKFGFRLRAQKGSHCVFTRTGVMELLNFQSVGGNAKPYQVRQLINIVEKYDLEMEE
jgi:hypothetical protein